MAVYLHTVYTNIDKQAITLARQTLSTLTELAMGNQTNQVVLFDSKGAQTVVCRPRRVDGAAQR